MLNNMSDGFYADLPLNAEILSHVGSVVDENVLGSVEK